MSDSLGNLRRSANAPLTHVLNASQPSIHHTIPSPDLPSPANSTNTYLQQAREQLRSRIQGTQQRNTPINLAPPRPVSGIHLHRPAASSGHSRRLDQTPRLEAEPFAAQYDSLAASTNPTLRRATSASDQFRAIRLNNRHQASARSVSGRVDPRLPAPTIPLNISRTLSVGAFGAQSEEITAILEVYPQRRGGEMDEFAQTRGQDDLFNDDFEPIVAPVTRAYEPQNPPPQQHRPTERRKTDESTTQGDVPRQPTSQKPAPDPTAPPFEPSQPPDSSETSTTSPPLLPNPQHKPPTAVRGDRTATGGVAKPKLTEDELSARLAAAKLNNAKRAEAHRIAEADEASFQQREAKASQKLREEGQARRVMDMERERNRVRKLAAQGGREWDEGKEEVQAREQRGRGGQFRRGAHGTVSGGLGGRSGIFAGRRDGDGAGSGGIVKRGNGAGRGGVLPVKGVEQKAPDPVADFPALPKTGKGDWADEVQADKEAKWVK